MRTFYVIIFLVIFSSLSCTSNNASTLSPSNLASSSPSLPYCQIVDCRPALNPEEGDIDNPKDFPVIYTTLADACQGWGINAYVPNCNQYNANPPVYHVVANPESLGGNPTEYSCTHNGGCVPYLPTPACVKAHNCHICLIASCSHGCSYPLRLVSPGSCPTGQEFATANNYQTPVTSSTYYDNCSDCETYHLSSTCGGNAMYYVGHDPESASSYIPINPYNC